MGAQIFMIAAEKCCLWKEEDMQLYKDGCEFLGLNKNHNNNNGRHDKDLSWQECMIVSKKAYHDTDNRINEYVHNGPRLYAAVFCANVCSDLGETIFYYHPLIYSYHSPNNENKNNNTDSSSSLEGGIGDTMCSTMEALENHCANMKLKIKSVYTHPHLRRVKELLTWYATKYRHSKVDLGKKVGVKKQRTLDIWIENDNGDNDSSDEDEDDEREKGSDKSLADESKGEEKAQEI